MRVSNLILIVIGTLVGLIVVEIGYRSYLFRMMPERFTSSATSGAETSLWYYQTSPYRYSRQFGYEYVPGVHNGGAITDGRVTACFDSLMNINERGNAGSIRGRYEDADLRILVFGDSFGVSGRPGPQWPEFLQDHLTERLGRDVHVVNFSRDGYGILQMFDLAGAKIAEWKPDLAVMAFITHDLARDRFWRAKVMLDGRERIMTSTTPDPNFDWSTAGDVYLMNSAASHAWCQHALSRQDPSDPIAVSLVDTLQEGRRRASHLANAFSVTQSFVVDLMFRGEPFYSTTTTAPAYIWPQHALWSFDEDAGMRRNVRLIQSTSTPLVLFHLAHHVELKNGDEYAAADERDLSLAHSLYTLTGTRISETLENAVVVGELNDLVIDPRSDLHPSVAGAKFYAEAVANELLRSGTLTRGLAN